jgi:hypothetical protein
MRGIGAGTALTGLRLTTKKNRPSRRAANSATSANRRSGLVPVPGSVMVYEPRRGMPSAKYQSA